MLRRKRYSAGVLKSVGAACLLGRHISGVTQIKKTHIHAVVVYLASLDPRGIFRKEKKEAETEQWRWTRGGGGREGKGRRQDPNNNETRVEVVSSRETPIMKYSSLWKK